MSVCQSVCQQHQRRGLLVSVNDNDLSCRINASPLFEFSLHHHAFPDLPALLFCLLLFSDTSVQVRLSPHLYKHAASATAKLAYIAGAGPGPRYMSPPPRGLSPVRSMGRSPSRLGAFDRGAPEGSGPPDRLGQSRLGPPGPAPGRHERTVWIGQVSCHLCYRDATALPCPAAVHSLSMLVDFASPCCDNCTAHACADISLCPVLVLILIWLPESLIWCAALVLLSMLPKAMTA